MIVEKAEEKDYREICDLFLLNRNTLMADRLPPWNRFRIVRQHGRVEAAAGVDDYSKRLMELRGPALRPGLAYEPFAGPLVLACEQDAIELGAFQLLTITDREQFFNERGYTVHFREKLALFRKINGGRLLSYELYLIDQNRFGEIKIRQGEEADRRAIQELIALYPEQLIQDFLPEPERFLVADAGNRLAGCIGFEKYSWLGECRSFAVHPDFRCGHGIGRRLLAHCIAWAFQEGVYELLAVTTADQGAKSHQLFLEFGFGTFSGGQSALVKVLGHQGGVLITTKAL